MAKRTPLIKNRHHALVLGYAGVIIGAVALYDAYEKRGKERPFITRFLPS